MEYFIGLIIAIFIALTGVGAGTITVPVLVLFLGVPAPVAVGIGLMFATAVKLILVPAQIARKNVAWRTLGYMLLGGAPGVLLGSLFLQHLISAGSANTAQRYSGRNSGQHRQHADLLLISPNAATSRNERSQPAPLMAHVSRGRRGRILFRRRRRTGLSRTALAYAAPAGPSRRYRYRLRFPRLAHRQRRALFSHATNTTLLLHLISGGVIGAIAGTILSSRVPRRPLRFVLWVWLLILGGQFLFNSYHVWAATR